MNNFQSENKTLLAGEALEANRRVKLSSGEAVYADAGEDAIGITMHAVADAGYVAVKLFNDSGTHLICAAGTFAQGAALYGAADGKVDDTVSGNKQFIALEACTAANQLIECVPVTAADVLAVQSHIADPAACADMTQNTLTDSGGGTADQTVEDVADIAIDTTDTYADSAVNTAVNTAIASISNNFKEMTTELALIKTDNAATKTAIDANNTAIDSILAALEASGIVLSS